MALTSFCTLLEVADRITCYQAVSTKPPYLTGIDVDWLISGSRANDGPKEIVGPFDVRDQAERSTDIEIEEETVLVFLVDQAVNEDLYREQKERYDEDCVEVRIGRLISEPCS